MRRLLFFSPGELRPPARKRSVRPAWSRLLCLCSVSSKRPAALQAPTSTCSSSLQCWGFCSLRFMSYRAKASLAQLQRGCRAPAPGASGTLCVRILFTVDCCSWWPPFLYCRPAGAPSAGVAVAARGGPRAGLPAELAGLQQLQAAGDLPAAKPLCVGGALADVDAGGEAAKSEAGGR